MAKEEGQVASNTPSNDSSYNLTATISKYLDPHLILPLLDFLEDNGLYQSEDITKEKIKILQKTSMIDFALQLNGQLSNPVVSEEVLQQKREKVIEKLNYLQEASKQIVDLFQDEEVLNKLRQEKQHNIKFLKDQYNVKVEQIDTLYEYAKFQFDVGDYLSAAELLYHFRIVSTDPEKDLKALWGTLASEILVDHTDSVLEDFGHLRSAIDSRQGTSALELLQQRTWLIHWGLFIFFKTPKGREEIISLLFNHQYKQAIQTTCPHILRYLTAAVILNKRRGSLKDLVAMIQQEVSNYRDPVTQFIESLYINFDFDGAQKTLLQCEKVLASDYFLSAHLAEFLENARLFIFETYCKIHQRIDIEMLAQKLNMERNQAERWIVDLIRNAQLDAKIDSENNTVNMAQKDQNIHQQVIEKTKGLAFRTNMLANSIDKKEAALAAQKNNSQQQGQGQQQYQQNSKKSFKTN